MYDGAGRGAGTIVDPTLPLGMHSAETACDMEMGLVMGAQHKVPVRILRVELRNASARRLAGGLSGERESSKRRRCAVLIRCELTDFGLDFGRF